MQERASQEDSQNQSARRMVDLSDDLIGAARVRYVRQHNPQPANREVVTRAVDEFLGTVIERLQHAGLTGRPTGRRRPRNLDVRTWQQLLDAETSVASSQIELLRCCLVLAARKGR
jgi:hypothetical protein